MVDLQHPSSNLLDILAEAVARKLAVLLHRLWVSGETYRPLRAGDAEASAA